MNPTAYRGRFAPSPTGELHMGSLLAAVVSYLEAKRHAGEWLVRIENVDRPREVRGSAEGILATLDALGFEWHGETWYQSDRDLAYLEAFEQLKSRDLAYPCGCTRREIADSGIQGIEGPVYPGTCRSGLPAGKEPRSWRVRTDDSPCCFDDDWQGRQCQRLTQDIGDYVILRADGYWAYQLAVVVDDAAQGITHVVRGADLLASTPRQIHLQRLLGLPSPQYAHFPVLLGADGQKLSKQAGSAPVSSRDPVATLWKALDLLGQQPPTALLPTRGRQGSLPDLWEWAEIHWNTAPLQQRNELGQLAGS